VVTFMAQFMAQFMAHFMAQFMVQFPCWMLCTFILVLPTASVQCQIWLFSLSLILCLPDMLRRYFLMILTWFQLPLLFITTTTVVFHSRCSVFQLYSILFFIVVVIIIINIIAPPAIYFRLLTTNNDEIFELECIKSPTCKCTKRRHWQYLQCCG
jgi:hypothetical protein